MAGLHWRCRAVLHPTGLLVLALALAVLQQPAWSSQDHYRTLGISKTADGAAIRGAYKRLALKLHPDKLGGKPKEHQRQQFLRIQAAYEVLSDPEKRRNYDRYGSAAQDGQWRQHHQQQQQQQHFHQQWQQRHAWGSQEDTMPSNTIKLTAWNFRLQVLNNAKPFLIQVYSPLHVGCREAAPKWEAAHAHLARDGWAQLGRVNWHHEQHLVHAMSQGTSMFGYVIGFEELPVVFGVPPGCADFTCFKRYQGHLDSTSALLDFVADELLQLPALPLLTLETMPAFIQQTPSHMVTGIAFSNSKGSSSSSSGSSGGSLRLRRLAWRQRRLVRWGRVQLAAGGQDVALWQERFGVQRAPALVLLRGPGTEPQVVPVSNGGKTDLEALMAQQGLAWQALPPLRSTTATALGCNLGAPAIRTSNDDATHWRQQQQGRQQRQGALAELCVVVMGRPGASLDAARANLLRLGEAMKAGSGLRGLGTVWRPLGKALGSGALQLAWMDTSWQPQVCHWHMRHMGATGDAVDDVARRVCGPGMHGWRSAVPRAAVAAAAVAAEAVTAFAGRLAALMPSWLWQHGETEPTRAPVMLLAYRPFGQGLQWRRHAYYHELHPDVGLLGGELEEGDKEGLGRWLASCLQESRRRDSRLPPQSSQGELPPQLQPESEPWWGEGPPLEAAQQWLSRQGSQLREMVRSAVLQGLSESVRPLLPVLLAGLLMLGMLLVMRAPGGGPAHALSVDRAQEQVILDGEETEWHQQQEEEQQGGQQKWQQGAPEDVPESARIAYAEACAAAWGYGSDAGRQWANGSDVSEEGLACSGGSDHTGADATVGSHSAAGTDDNGSIGVEDEDGWHGPPSSDQQDWLQHHTHEPTVRRRRHA